MCVVCVSNNAFVCSYAYVDFTIWSQKRSHCSCSLDALHVYIYHLVTLLQAKVATLKALDKRASTKAGARTITVADIRSAVACSEPAHAETGKWLCRFMLNSVLHLKSAGCDLIMEAGAIPVIFEQLRRWPAEANIVKFACMALFNLSYHGSAAVKLAMRSVPDCEALLRAARASGLDVHNGQQFAAVALTKLGF